MNKDFEIRDNVVYSYTGSDEHVIIPEGITAIDSEALENNKTMKVIELPSTLNKLDGLLFFGCDNLKNIIISEENPHIVKINDCIYSKDRSVLIFYPPYLKNDVFEIPSFVKEIGVSAFYHSLVKKVICNIGLKTINEGAFDQCQSLDEIVLSNTISKIYVDYLGTSEPALKITAPVGSSFTIADPLSEQ